MGEIVCLNTGALAVNTFIVSLADNDVFVVDPAACRETGDENLITGWLSSHGKSPVGIFLTHGHFDHITGIKAIVSAYPECIVAIHKLDKNSFDKHDESSAHSMLSMFGMYALVPAVSDIPYPEMFFNGGETLDCVFGMRGENAVSLNEETVSALASWKIIHTPGHSPGSCCLYSQKENALISGDTMFYHSWGRTDFAGGNEMQLQRSLAMLRDTIPPETKVYPGHETYGFKLIDN